MASLSRVSEAPATVSGDAAAILKGATWFGIATLLGMVLEYATQAFLAARLGPAEFGVFSIGLQIFMFCLVLGSLALPQALAHFIPRSDAENQVGSSGRLVSFGLTLSVAGALLCAAVLILLAPRIAEDIFRAPELTTVLRLFGLALPLWAPLLLTAGALRGLRLSRQASLLTGTHERALRLGFTVALVAAGLGLEGAAIAYLCGSGLALLWGLRCLRASRAAPRLRLPSRPLTRRVAVYAAPLLVAQLLEQARRAALPLLVAFFVDVRAAGIYAVAFLIATGMTTVLVALNFIYLPVVSGLSFERDRERIRRLYEVVTTWGVLCVLPVCLLILLTPESFLGIFGAAYEEGAPALRLLAIAALVNVAVGTVGSTLLAAGKTGLYLRINLGGMVLATGLSLALIPSFGLTGAAAADLLVSVLWNGCMLVIVHRMYGFQPFRRTTLATFGLAVVTLALVAPAVRQAAEWTPWAVVAFTPVYVGIVVGLAARWRLAGPDVTETVKNAADAVRCRLGGRRRGPAAL